MHTDRLGLSRTVFRGVLFLAAFWVLAFALVQAGERLIGGWAASVAALMLACCLGVYLAVRMQMKLIALVLAGLVAFSASELVLRSIYGMQSVQGSGAHFAVMFAGILGVLFGWRLSRADSPAERVVRATVSDAPAASSAASPEGLVRNLA